MTALPAIRADAVGLLRRSGLLADGFAAGEIDRMLRSGLLESVRRGVYRYADREAESTERAHALRCHALYPKQTSGAFGYVSAAILLRLPVWGVPLGRLHVVEDRSGRGQVRPGVHVHGSPLPASDVVEVDGLRVTSAARSVADMARSVSFESALVTVDGALYRARRNAERDESHPGAAAVDEIGTILDRFVRRRGIPAARRVLAFADPGSESPGETRSRFAMHVAGLPPPVTQCEVPGTPFRTDFAWPEFGVVGEFDGKIKYGRSLRPEEDPAERLWREKRREDRIRATGLTVVRWTWWDIAGAGADAMLSQLSARLRR